MDDLRETNAALEAGASAAVTEFLRTELRVANTMLDLVAASSDESARQRRAEQAQAAYNVVAAHLRRTAPQPPLSAEDRRELEAGLSLLDVRMERVAPATGHVPAR